MNNCYKTSNNKYFDCPARMSDARHFTDYKPNCELIAQIKVDNKLNNSFETRNFLQNNASKLMGINQEHSCHLNCCNLQEDFADTMAPCSHQVECDKNNCKRTLVNKDGIGDCRTYYNKVELEKCQNLPRQWPVANRETNMCATPMDNYAYVNDLDKANKLLRHATPTGGQGLCN